MEDFRDYLGFLTAWTATLAIARPSVIQNAAEFVTSARAVLVPGTMVWIAANATQNFYDVATTAMGPKIGGFVTGAALVLGVSGVIDLTDAYMTKLEKQDREL